MRYTNLFRNPPDGEASLEVVHRGEAGWFVQMRFECECGCGECVSEYGPHGTQADAESELSDIVKNARAELVED